MKKIIFLALLVPLLVSAVATTTDTINVNLTVTDSCNGNGVCAGNETFANCPADCNIGGGGPPPPPPPPPPPTCNITVPSGFSGFYVSSSNKIVLSWSNPNQSCFSAVRIMRSTTFFPASISEGELIYDGAGEATDDTNNIVPGTTYYYSIFSRDTSGNYSAAAVTIVVAVEPPPPPPPPPPPILDDCALTGTCPIEVEVGCEVRGDCRDPFNYIPQSTTTPPVSVTSPSFWFDFIQKDRSFRFNGGRVRVNGGLDLTVSLDYEKVPEVLKTIGVTIHHPRDFSKTFSFILKINGDKTAYLANVAPLLEAGNYPVTIHIIDYKNQTVRKINGVLSVTNLSPAARTVSRAITGLGVAVGVGQAIVLTTNITSLYDLYLLFLKLIGALLGYLGFKKRAKPWGTVYDSVTKRPLDPAYVVVRHGSEEMSSAITDLDGRFGFLIAPGIYKMEASKTHYKFPSDNLKGKQFDELYANLYFGEEFQTREGEVISRNIPMDPIGFDWNEFVKNKANIFEFHTKRERLQNILFNIFYLAGFLSTLVASYFEPIVFNFVILAIYVVLFALQLFWKGEHKAVRVVDKRTGLPLAFAIIRVFVASVNREIKAVVSDNLGRFYLLLPSGSYYLTIEAKQPDGAYIKVYQSDTMELSHGVLKKDVVIE